MWKTLKFRGRKPAIVVLALLILAAVVFIFVINRPPSVEVLVVKEQPYSEKVIAVGQLKPEQVTTLIAEVNGTVKSFHAEEGSTVAAGEILIRIEKTITLDYESARSEYARLRSLASAASADYNNAKTLYAEGAISKSDLTAKKMPWRLHYPSKRRRSFRWRLPLIISGNIKFPSLGIPWC